MVIDQARPAIQRKVQFPNNSRLESRVGFNISTTPNQPTINTSDNEQNTRNDNSNYDSLVGSLKSDTINWKDQQSTVRFATISFFFLYYRNFNSSSLAMRRVMLKVKKKSKEV